MTITIEPLDPVALSARMFCEAPLCSAPATHKAIYTYALDNEDPRDSAEVLCDHHAGALQADLNRDQSTVPEVLLPSEICCPEFPECTCGLNQNNEPISADDLNPNTTQEPMQASIQPTPMHCEKCQHIWHENILVGVTIKVWCTHVRSVRCPNCGASANQLSLVLDEQKLRAKLALAEVSLD